MLLLKCGTIATMDPDMPFAEAAIVDGDRFAYVGGLKEAREYLNLFPGEKSEELDLKGAFLMPGFNDSHLHLIHYVKSLLSVDLFGIGSMAELCVKMAEAAKIFSGEDGRWLIGEGWNQEKFSDQRRFPTCHDLDSVCGEHPALIMRSCFHVGVLNSKGMELLGINRDTVSRFGVFAELDENGEPNGVIKENVLDDIKATLPSPGLEALLRQLELAQYDLFAGGLTSVQSDDFKYAPEENPYAMLDGLRQMAEDGRLKLRIAEQALLTEPETLEEFWQRGGAHYGNSDRFRISTVKILADGSLGARTALLKEPYSDSPGQRGLAVYERQEDLDALVLSAHRHGMPAAIHAIGDGGADMALTAISKARKAAPWLNPRHGLVHCQVLDAEQIETMKRENVSAFVQPVFINGDMHIAPARLGNERLSGAYAWNSLVQAGVPISFGTDCPVENFRPLDGIYCAVTRCDLDGNGPFLPQQALSPLQALQAYTTGAAYASGEEDIKGMIRAGMLADFIVLDKNLLSCPPMEIKDAQVLTTYIGGECVYRR